MTITASSDVYAFAMTLLEIVTGARPFLDLPNDGAVVVAVVVQNRRPRADLPLKYQFGGRLRELMEHCWRTDPRQRPDMAMVAWHLEEMCPRARFATSFNYINNTMN